MKNKILIVGLLLLLGGLVSATGNDVNRDGLVDARDIYYCQINQCQAGLSDSILYEIRSSAGGGFEALTIGSWCDCNAADLNDDGTVNLVDLGLVGQAWGTPNADMNGDGITNAEEQGCVEAYYNEDCGIVPGVDNTILFIGLGAIALIGGYLYFK